MKEFWLCFVPLFIAVDPLGTLPMFIGLTERVPAERKPAVIFQSVVTAAAVALLFLLLGDFIFKFVGVDVADFMVAGGILLFVLSISDLMSAGVKARNYDTQTVGVVPIGVPLITGPAVLTTGVLLVHQHGMFPAVLATVANILIAGLLCFFATPITAVLGNAGAKAAAKISSILLAAIGVMIVRNGIIQIIKAAKLVM